MSADPPAKGPPRGRRRRVLSEEERSIWGEVTRTIQPLRPLPARIAKAAPKASAADAPALAPGKEAAAKAVWRTGVKPGSAAGVRVNVALTAPRPPAVPAGSVLTRRELRRLARGAEQIGLRLDLHGMTRAQAHAILESTLQRAQRDGIRTVLVITGKGQRTGAYAEREAGVLRREVPLWLGLPAFRRMVTGFETAAIGHGGEGALYIRIRKP
ncbi:MAG TPA: Smr/MutS family protein [Xanthobacteraceae bacterium]|nr:Smr/MutS family protein [Xanthobacteraceae bacterium]